MRASHFAKLNGGDRATLPLILQISFAGQTLGRDWPGWRRGRRAFLDERIHAAKRLVALLGTSHRVVKSPGQADAEADPSTGWRASAGQPS
jgi:hypothetical protein